MEKNEEDSADAKPELVGIQHTKTKVLRGVNLYCPQSVIQLTYDLGAYAGCAVCDLDDGFKAQLFAHFEDIEIQFPSECAELAKTRARIENPGRFNLMGLLLNIIIFAQGVARSNPNTGKIYGESKSPHQRIVILYEHIGVSEAAAELALNLINNCLAGDKFDFLSSFEEFRTYGRKRLHLETNLLNRAARKFNLPRETLFGRGGWIALGVGKYRKLHIETITEQPSRLSNSLINDKSLTAAVLQHNGFPAPEQRDAKTAGQAVRAAKDIGYPVVVKPRTGSQGKGISTGLISGDEVKRAFKIAAKINSRIVVESYLEGHDHRLLAINGDIVSAYKKERPCIVGDGRRSIEALVQELNIDPRRDGIEGRKIKLDDELDLLMARSGYDLQTILPPGETFVIRMTSNWTTGSMNVDVLAQINPEIRRMASRLSRCFDVDVLGIDYMTVDISRSFRDIGGGVIELNQRPGLSTTPVEGQLGADAVIRSMMPEGERSRGPAALIMGGSDTRKIALVLTHLLAMVGYVVGSILKQKSYVGGEYTGRTGNKSHRLVRNMIIDRRVEAVVHEIDSTKLALNGAGHDWMDSVVVTDVVDQYGDKGLAFQHCARSAVEATKGKGVLNGDDPKSAPLIKGLESEAGCSVHKDSKAAKSLFVVAGGGNKRMLAKRADIPALNSPEAEGLVKPVAMAAAAALDLGVTPKDLKFALGTLDGSLLSELLPMVAISGFPFRVIIALCHNGITPSRYLDVTGHGKGKVRRLVCFAMTGDAWPYATKWGRFDDELDDALADYVGKSGQVVVPTREGWQQGVRESLGVARKDNEVLILTDNPELLREFVSAER